jgi:hypothetical protein
MSVGAVIPMGYKGEENIAPKRKEVEELISYK